MQFAIIYLVGLVSFSLLEMLWVRYAGRLLYRSYIGHLQGHIKWAPLIAFYTIFSIGLAFFATNPAVTAGALGYAPVLGALYGFFMYATYNLLNNASLKAWPLGLTIIDTVWGTLASGTAAAVTYFVASSIL